MDPPKVNGCKEMDLRSTQDTDGGGSVQAVTGHQVRDVILDLSLLTREASSLKQLGPGRVVVLWAVCMLNQGSCSSQHMFRHNYVYMPRVLFFHCFIVQLFIARFQVYF